jgi:hypothetical protein
MGHLCISIAWVEDDAPESPWNELSRIKVPALELQPDSPSRDSLEALEQQTLRIGQDLMRNLLSLQWDILDQQQVEHYCAQFAPEEIAMDGYASQKVACRLGIVHLNRQVCFNRQSDQHIMPGNELLPEHHGTIITRSLQEWACLLPQDLPFATVERLLSWQTQQPEVISKSEVRLIVQRHGATIRAAEAQEVSDLEARADLQGFEVKVLDGQAPRHRAAWPAEISAAVAQALADPNPQPPEGVSTQDWQRVLQARTQEAACWPAERLRCLGPEVQPGQTIAATDDILVRRPAAGQWLTLRVARVATPDGYRYLSGTGSLLLRQLVLLLFFCGGLSGWVTLLGDGAKWLRDFFETRLSAFTHQELLLDWYHLRHKCANFASMICATREAKTALKKTLSASLWKGQVDAALEALEACRPQTKNEKKLQELIDYLRARKPYIVNYDERRRQQQYIGSAHAEKACDLIVAKRQKNRGMHWSEATADALAALKTVMLNQSWDLYWQKHQVLPLATAS